MNTNENHEQPGVNVIESLSDRTGHIRCLSVVPVELEELLAEIDAETEKLSEPGQ